jgi:hypothetical protein
MTFAIAFLFGSMFGACVGFIAAGARDAARSADAEMALTAERPFLGHAGSDVPLVPGNKQVSANARCAGEVGQANAPAVA